jgi:AcrR family transcriptional regulator
MNARSQMGRPRCVGDDAIVAAAVRVIGRRGPTHFTIREVAAEAGLSPAAVMQRFGTKRGLLLAIERDGTDRIERIFQAARNEPRPRLAALRDALAATAGDLVDREEMANHLAFLALDLADRELRDHVVASFRLLRARVQSLLDLAVADGELQDGTDTAGLARFIEVAYNGALITAAIHGRPTSADAVRDAISSVLAPYAKSAT